jgi:hypothetical protein
MRRMRNMETKWISFLGVAQASLAIHTFKRILDLVRIEKGENHGIDYLRTSRCHLDEASGIAEALETVGCDLWKVEAIVY